MSTVAAFFDLDGTLTTGHLYSNVVRERMRHPVGAVRGLAYLLSHFAMVIPYRLGLLDPARFFTSWMVDLAPLFKGMRPLQAEPEFRAVARSLVDDVREDVLELLRKHRSEGHLLVLVSGTFSPILEEVARLLDVEHVVGTSLEERDGHYTGRLAEPMCFADEKARRVRSFVEGSAPDIDMRASYAYSDRHNDLPFLELVGHPVATYPDEGLLAHARARGWRIVGGTGA